MGAEHYKKLALEKTRPVSCDCQTYQEKIKELTEEVGYTNVKGCTKIPAGRGIRPFLKSRDLASDPNQCFGSA